MPIPDSPTSSGQPPGAKRVPIRQQVDLQFPTFEGLVTEVSANLSTSGMFIQTDNPVPVSTEFSFGFSIEEWSPVQGRASVVWIREQAEGSTRPAGMGVKFVELDAQSRRMIRWIVDKNVHEGGQPFDPEKVPVGASRVVKQSPAQPTDDRKSGAGSGDTKTQQIRADQMIDAAAQPSSRRRRNQILTLAIVALAAYWGHFLWRQARSPERLVGADSPTAKTKAEIATTSETASASGLGSTGDSPTPRATPEEEVTTLVQEWAAAWTNRNVPALYALYSPNFEPAGSDRQAWQSSLSQQIETASFIRVALSGLEVSLLGSDEATATFYCSYRSDSSDQTRHKVMQLERTDGRWLILEERFQD